MQSAKVKLEGGVSTMRRPNKRNKLNKPDRPDRLKTKAQSLRTKTIEVK